MTEEVQRESRWKVGSSLKIVYMILNLLVSQGDVSLSAEDTPPPFTVNRPMPVDAAALPIDHISPHVGDDDEFEDYGEEEEEEEHHNWLEGHAAIKFLVAGGIAGAGE